MTLGAAGGGLLAAAFLPMAVAAADEYVYLPDPSTFEAFPPSTIGEPANISLSPLLSTEAGAEYWNYVDTKGGVGPDELEGVVEKFSILGGLITGDDLTETGSNSLFPFLPPDGSKIDLLQLPFGFGNELITTATSSTEFVITPFGDFALSAEPSLPPPRSG